MNGVKLILILIAALCMSVGCTMTSEQIASSSVEELCITYLAPLAPQVTKTAALGELNRRGVLADLECQSYWNARMGMMEATSQAIRRSNQPAPDAYTECYQDGDRYR